MTGPAPSPRAFDVTRLPWLPPPPADFTTRRRALTGLDAAAASAEIRILASHALTAVQAQGLGRAIWAVQRRDGGLADLAPLRLAVLAGSTFDLVTDHFAAAAARHGVDLTLVEAPFDSVETEARDPQAAVNTARPDFALIAVDHRWLRLDSLEPDGPEARVSGALRRLEGIAAALQRHGGAAPILCTAPAPPDPLFGSLDAAAPGAPAAMTADFNRRLPGLARTFGGAVLDVAALAARIGGDAWFDPAAWFTARLAFAPSCDAAYADLLGRLLGALRGRARKALVLDLDNTLWGGVVGDDGAEALRLGPGDPVGEAFAAVQRYALDLHQRGVFLAVASKNDEDLARRAFETRPGMVLRPEHIAVFKADWSDKPAHLAAIAAQLNIGVDALVFLDDNPVERALMRAALPGVATPELPADPSDYVRTLAAAGYFEAAAFSKDDRLRTRPRPSRASALVVADLGDYLSGLEMRLTLGPFDPADRPRVAQLINKTNQFNLTTIRRSEADVAALAAAPEVVTLQGRLADRFDEHGLITVVIARDAFHGGEPALEVETWLMSCRVLGRRVEDAVFAALLDQARTRGARWIVGRYRSTARNAPVADLLPRLGLTETSREGADAVYAGRIEDLTRPAPPIVVTSG